MFDGFAGELHAGLSGEDEAVAEDLGSGETFARFFGRVLGGDGLPGAEGDDANIPLALLFRDEASESANGVFADDIGGGTVIFGAPAAPEIDNISRATFLHERNHVLRAEKSTAQVGLNDAVPKILGHEADARPAGNAP